MIYKVIHCGAWSIDCLLEECDLSGRIILHFAFWLVTDNAYKDITLYTLACHSHIDSQS